MQQTKIRVTPKYFIAAFGEQYAGKHPVNGWEYPLGRLSNRYSYVNKGDIMLLYCTGSYIGYDMEAPAIGILIDTQIVDEGYTLYYRYLPLDQPIQRDTINASLDPKERNYFINPGANFIFEIKNTSFQRALKDRHIIWP